MSKDGLRYETVEEGGRTQVLASNAKRSMDSPDGVGIFDDVSGEGLVLHYQYLNMPLVMASTNLLAMGVQQVGFQDGWPVVVS